MNLSGRLISGSALTALLLWLTLFINFTGYTLQYSDRETDSLFYRVYRLVRLFIKQSPQFFFAINLILFVVCFGSHFSLCLPTLANRSAFLSPSPSLPLSLYLSLSFSHPLSLTPLRPYSVFCSALCAACHQLKVAQL